MADFYSVLTNVGKAALLNAAALGTTVTLTEMAVGDGDGAAMTPTEDMVSLTHEVYRAGINVLDVVDASTMRAELVIPTNVGGWYVREVGIVDAEGQLFAVANLPDTYKPALTEGAGRELTVVLLMEITNSDAVTLKIDPTVILSTRSYVDKSITTHNTDPAAHGAIMPGPATIVERGLVELATSEETVAGTDAERAVTPAADAAALEGFRNRAHAWAQAQTYAPTVLAITSGAVIWDVQATPVAVIVLTEDITSLTVNNAVIGASYELTIIQDSTGGRTMSWPAAWLWPGGTAQEISTAPLAEDVVHLTTRSAGGDAVAVRATCGQEFKAVA